MAEQLGIRWGEPARKEGGEERRFSHQEALELFGKGVKAKDAIRTGVTGMAGVIGRGEQGLVSRPVERPDGSYGVQIVFEVDREGQKPATQAELSRTARAGQKFLSVSGPEEFARLFEFVEEVPVSDKREKSGRQAA